MKEKREMRDESGAVASPAETPDLRTEKAFLVQLSLETGPTLEPLAPIGKEEELCPSRLEILLRWSAVS